MSWGENPDQADADLDGTGNACDAAAVEDRDGDGVDDVVDLCPDTAIGALVDPGTGCALDQLCPCEGPQGSTKPWKNHGQYVVCVTASAATFVKNGLVSLWGAGALVSEAARSGCGRK